jgi:hypothetical protein
MTENINGSTIIIILILIIGLFLYHQTFNTENKSCPPCNCTISAEHKPCNCSTREEKPVIVNVHQDEQIVPPINPAREYDYRTFSDPLVPPYKRSDYDLTFPPGMVGGTMPIATRGYPSGFKKMGILNDKNAPNDDKFKFMTIMGRQTYPGSNQYDYYITETKEDSPLKFDLKDLRKELNDGDSIQLSDLDKTYTVKLDRDLGFRYTPFVF